MQLQYIKTDALPQIEHDGPALTGMMACVEIDEAAAWGFGDSLTGWSPYEQIVTLGIDTPAGREHRFVMVDDEMISYIEDVQAGRQ